MSSGPPGLDMAVLANRGQEVATVIELVEKEASDLRKGVFNKVFTKIEAGQLSPEEALSHWQEVYASHKFLKRLQTAITIGKSAAEKSPAALAGKEKH